MPSFSMVVFIVAPFMRCPAAHACMCERGAAVVRVQNQRPQRAAFGQHRLPDQNGRQVCALTFMDLPANDLPAEDVPLSWFALQTTTGQRIR